jgi:PAS domain S-box-containing protein
VGAFSLSRPPQVSRRNVLFWTFLLLVTTLSTLLIWPSLWRDAFSSAYLPHSFCYLSQGKLIWLHLISDSLIGSAYVAISISLAYLVYRARRDIPFHWMFLAFGLFIVSCGMTHFMEVVVLWKPLYWFSGDVKVVTALASVATALALPVVVPRVLALIEFRRVTLENDNNKLEELNRRLVEREQIKTALVRETVAGVAGWELSYPSGEITWSEDPSPLFGRTAADLTTVQQLEPTAHPDDRPRLRKLLSEPHAAAQGNDFEYRIVWPDGSVRWLALKARSCHDGQAAPLRLVGLATDVTNRKLEEALRSAEKLAAAGRLAATIAHEINNPLEAVTNLLYLMRDGHNSEYLNKAEQEVARISHIVKQTLGFYRATPTPVRVSLATMIDKVLGVFRARVLAREVKLKTEYRCTDEISAYPNELSQVFGNLVGNALDALNPGGTLCVRTLTCHSGQRVTIADNGAGIARENLGKIFEPFFTANKDVGTGLGLWLAREIVQKHGGSIRVRSRTDAGCHGTVFMIWLPLTVPTAQGSVA